MRVCSGKFQFLFVTKERQRVLSYVGGDVLCIVMKIKSRWMMVDDIFP